MLRALEANGSPLPLFETDADRSYFRVTFFLHSAFSEDIGKTTNKSAKRKKKADVKEAILSTLSLNSLSSQDLAVKVGYATHRSGAYYRVVNELVGEGKIAYTIPNNPRDMNQKLYLVQMKI